MSVKNVNNDRKPKLGRKSEEFSFIPRIKEWLAVSILLLV